MLIFIDESGDLGWTLDKPNRKGGSSNFITIAGIVIDDQRISHLVRYTNEMFKKHNLEPHVEKKGSSFSNNDAAAMVKHLAAIHTILPSFKMISITSNKQHVRPSLRKDQVVFYNHMLSVLLTDVIQKYDNVKVVLDNRTIRLGSRNSFEDCIRGKCWGELGLDVGISCRYEESDRNPGIWLADWLANFVWRHYEYNMNEAYLECCAQGDRYHERTLFM